MQYDTRGMGRAFGSTKTKTEEGARATNLTGAN